MDLREQREQLKTAIRVGRMSPMFVAEHYAVRDGFIVADGKAKNLYEAYGCPELPAELAGVPFGDEGAALAFVHKWGLLGWVEMEKAEPLQHPRGGSPEDPATVGDPLDWFWNHARTVKMLLDFLAAYGTGDPQVCLDALEKLPPVPIPPVPIGPFQPSAGPRESARVAEIAFINFRQPSLRFVTRDEMQRPQDRLGVLAGLILTANLQALTQVVLPDRERPGLFRRQFISGSLLPIIYVLVADAACGERPYVSCRTCGRYFLQAHARQQYCPNPGGGGESLCSNRARYQRYRKTKAAQKGGQG